MGTIKQGILGGFSGKVGTVIGASWKGIDTMRGIAQHVKNPRTRDQLVQRAKFSLVLPVMQSMNNFLRVGYKNQANKQTEFNAAFSYNIQNAVSGNYPDFNISFADLMVSRGNLPKAANPTATPSEGAITFAWEDNSDEQGASETDVVMVLCYDKDTNETFCMTTNTGRRHEDPPNLLINIPARNAGHKMECYMAFISDDGKRTSDSVFVGEVTAQ